MICTFINIGRKRIDWQNDNYNRSICRDGGIKRFLNIELLEGRVEDGWRNYYTAVYNMYSLQSQCINGGKNQICETLANYIMADLWMQC